MGAPRVLVKPTESSRASPGAQCHRDVLRRAWVYNRGVLCVPQAATFCRTSPAVAPLCFSEWIFCSESVFHHLSLEGKGIYGTGSARHQLSTYQSEYVSARRSEMEAHEWS